MPILHKHSGSPPEPVPVTMDDLTISMEGVDVDALLAEWRWLVDESYTPVLLTALGDLFLEAPDGSIHWLQTGRGRFRQVAESGAAFEQLVVRPEQVQKWFSPKLVGSLKAQGMELGPGQCYGYMNPPCLGGRNEPLNLEPTDLYVHFSILGQIAAQINDVPPAIEMVVKTEPMDIQP
jgi:hypothetical protein